MVVGAVGFVLSAWDRAMGNRRSHPEGTLSDYLLGKRRHRSTMYVLARPVHREARTVDPSDVNQWRFYVVPSGKIDGRDPRTISEPMLTSMGEEVSYGDLSEAVRRAAEPESN